MPHEGECSLSPSSSLSFSFSLSSNRESLRQSKQLGVVAVNGRDAVYLLSAVLPSRVFRPENRLTFLNCWRSITRRIKRQRVAGKQTLTIRNCDTDEEENLKKRLPITIMRLQGYLSIGRENQSQTWLVSHARYRETVAVGNLERYFRSRENRAWEKHEEQQCRAMSPKERNSIDGSP